MITQSVVGEPAGAGAGASDELEELLAEVEDEVEAAPANNLDELDSLLEESVALRAEAAEAKAARERLRKRGAGSGRTPEEIAEDEARVREWELRNDWQATANVALFERYRCSCGRQQTIFRQLMQRQVHRTLQATERWQAVEVANPDLPNEIMVQKWSTGLCTHCAAQSGFDFATLPVREWEQ